MPPFCTTAVTDIVFYLIPAGIKLKVSFGILRDHFWFLSYNTYYKLVNNDS